MTSQTASHAEVVHLFGPIDDHLITEILDLQATPAELEVAAAYCAGMTDVLGDVRQPLFGNAARICEIIRRNEETGEEDIRRD